MKLDPSRPSATKQHPPVVLATGWAQLVGPAIAINLALLIYSLFTPVLVTRFLILSRHELVLAKAALDLFHADLFLFMIVAVFGIVAPCTKLLVLGFIWYFVDISRTQKCIKWLVLLSKLSMVESMSIAVFVVAIKGIIIGSTEIKNGLYFYGTAVISSLALTLWVEQQLARLNHENQV